MNSIITRIVAVLVLSMCFLTISVCDLFAQNVNLTYAEREIAVEQTPLLFKHPKGGPFFMALSRAGLYTLDSATLRPKPVAVIAAGKVYEGNYISTCGNGDILYSQAGFFGGTLFRIDSQGIASSVPLPSGVVTDLRFRENGTVLLEMKDTAGVYSEYASVDCGATWFARAGAPIVSAKGAILLRESNPVRYSIARPGLGNVLYPTRLKSDISLLSFSILGKDSVVWINRGRTSTTRDTIWYSDVRDSSRYRFDTSLVVSGIQEVVDMKRVQLLSSYAGTLFMFSRQGWYARYRNGSWRVVDTLPPFDGPFVDNSNAQSSGYALQYIDYKGSQLVTISLDSAEDGHSLTKVAPSLLGTRAMRFVSPGYSALYYKSMTTPICLFSPNEGNRVLNGVFPANDNLASPMQFGFVNSRGEPLVVPYSDCAVRISGAGVGVMKAWNMRGEYWSVKGGISGNAFVPRVQSDRGLRTPFVGTGEVLSPGLLVRRYTRDGELIDTLRNQPATAVYRLPDSTVVIGNGSHIITTRPGGKVDSVDFASVVCGGSGMAGFVESFALAGDGSLLAFVNGLLVLDQETLSSRPLRCGGVLRSTDDGRTWTSSELPIEYPYFLGSIRTLPGTIVASVTQVVRDTTKRASPSDLAPLDETLNHKFNDAYVVRSTDNGVSWTKVFTRRSSPAYGLIGGNGVVTDEGALLLLTTDGTLRSTNDGMDWELNTVTGMADGAQIISMFQDTPGSPIYFCTTEGLYKQGPVMSVKDMGQSAAQRFRAARTWEGHRSAWQQCRQTVRRLVSALGESLSMSHQPPAGLYMAEVSDGSAITMEPILVLEE
ncbi:MAG: hypothetical protein FGM32_09295 [Candidatus Kapabacteria bacterium]|nr:hypothetical protein [Candidatus Kapabacteria bacterium]